MDFRGTVVTIRRTLANPWVNNGLTLAGGVAQVGSGLFIAAVTSPSGIGPVAGGVIAIQGTASASVALGNLVNLTRGTSPIVNNTGIVGLGTSIVTLGTSSKKTNNIAMVTDMSFNVLFGGIGTGAANQAIAIKASVLTINSHVLDTTFGAGKWLPNMKDPSGIVKSTNLFGAASNVADAHN